MPTFDVPKSPWGELDQLGAANRISSISIRSALAMVREGQVFDLSQDIHRSSPRAPLDQSPYTLSMWVHPSVSQRSFERAGATNGIGFAIERVEMDLHTGTHIDALGHCVMGDRLFNGYAVADFAENWGLTRLGVENLPPLITRGVLVDCVSGRGSPLEPGEPITRDDLSAYVEEHGIEIRGGDIVLVRTGWGTYYRERPIDYVGAAPGLDPTAGDWLAERGVVAVGSDTLGLEVVNDDATDTFPVHQQLLVRSGIYIIENAYLEDLAHSSFKEFACFCLPCRFVGGTASPVRLTAVV
jgi:kynurenine formamidase